MFTRQKYYCHMCRKQCRDDHGFRCHKTSESHRRNMLRFIEDPERYVEQFSSEFEEEFTKVLEARFPTQWVQASQVYGLSLSSKRQIHLNSTKWESLHQFIDYFTEKGIIEMQESEENGLMIRIKPRKNTEIVKEKEENKGNDDAFALKRIMKIADEVKNKGKPEENSQISPINSSNFNSFFTINASKPVSKAISTSIDDSEPLAPSSTLHPKSTPLDYLGSHTLPHKRNRTESGHFPVGVTLKVTDRDSVWYNLKGNVCESSKDRVVLEFGNGRNESFTEAQVQNVVPNVGGEVMVLAGQWRGVRGRVVSVKVKEGTLEVEVSGERRGSLRFGEVCKTAAQ